MNGFLIQTQFISRQLIGQRHHLRDMCTRYICTHRTIEQQLELNNAAIKLRPLVQKHNYSELDNLSTQFGRTTTLAMKLKPQVLTELELLEDVNRITECIQMCPSAESPKQSF